MRRFEYCVLSNSRDMKNRDYPWTGWVAGAGGRSEKLEIGDDESVLDIMGSRGWELVGPPEVTRWAQTSASFNHVSGLIDSYIDLGSAISYTYYFKREVT